MINYDTFFDNGKLNRNKIQETWIKNHFPIDYSNIVTFIQETNIQANIFSQGVYHYIFKISEIPICNKCQISPKRFLGFSKGYNDFCSKRCASSSSSKKGIETRTKRTREKYGVDHTSQLEIVKYKTKITNIEKYGSVSPAENKDVLNKIIKTNREKYGVDHPLQNKLILSNLKMSFSNKYGVDNPTKIDSIKDKIRTTSLINWGSDWPSKSIEVINKIKKSRSNSIELKIIDTYSKIDTLEFISYSEGLSKFKCCKCNESFEIGSHLLYQRYIKHNIEICTNCNKLNSKTSNGHIEISNFLSENGINFIMNDRSKIPPYELDIFIPSYNIGIEFNGVYWHSELIKDKKYHILKRDMSKKCDIDLIQIWEDDWKFKGEIVKSIIKSKIGGMNIVKWGRKLKIEKNISENVVKKFLNDNHLQGWCVSSLKYGLFEGDELISIMTFSKGRKNINGKEWEIVRFCNKINHTVLGSFNKLIGSFIKDHNPGKIISYSDNDLFSGNSYQKYGMIISNQSPNYWWCDGRIRHNRWKFRKDVLLKNGNDKSLSGPQIMIHNGYFRCWGSGTTRWEYLIQNFRSS